MEINDISKIRNLSYISKDININNSKKDSFGNFLKEALDKVNSLQVEAEHYNKLLAMGQIDNIHEVMIASEKANIALQLTLSIRNKVIDAYKEIMRMQI
ncbi:flagellar hook-basal body complex protein FliE [Caloranaerobacter azorensis]|uniref:Flagellar hook-basal body complex protein FliE n=2 Tax=Caloranaerobacter azorensis TaxID=116090 RepID=A0A1M5RMM4_9FIRM|nr:flagellar hook-basal body complex protein FliE [Caloranaerobacter azorensis]QIB26200.1 flagellar hook-basal body complex protein FliE [Caloranaerobacter azorensis]SHH27547.1 flagellar hook-basal body complex protein FliE [Caloranaerobacter azorensis DSM 13643]